MKNTIRVIALVVCLLSSVIHSKAIEGLQLSLQCSNVVLSWPSVETEIYIVQYRPTLDASNAWQTLTASFPADTGTNVTFFVHSNIVAFPNNCGGAMFAMSGASNEAKKKSSIFDLGVPLAKRADGTGSIVPLGLYPHGLNLSHLLVYDTRVSEDWIPYNDYSSEVESNVALRNNGPEPQDGGSGGGDGGAVSDMGFYRVVRVGPHLVGITNGMVLSGVVQIPVEVGSEVGKLVNLTLIENNVPVGSDSIHVGPFELPVPLVTLDTTILSNGVHEISAIAHWQYGDSTNEAGGFFEADCPTISIIVSNEVSFQNWQPYFGQLDNTVLITSQSAHLDTDWWVDIYGGNAGYIGTFTGHTTDGNIYGYWNLVGPPPNFIHYTNEPWFQFKVSTEYIDPPSPKTYKQADPWPSPGGWVIVAQHAWDHVTDHESLYQEMDGFIGTAQNSGYTVRPNPQDGHAFALRFGNDANANSDWAAFRQALFNPLSRNLVYFGHGAPNGLGQNLNNTNRSILVSEIATNLATMPAGLTNRRSFRFVFLDGCSTASGTLPESFGIIHRENVPSIDYANASMRYSAFVGWSSDKAISFVKGASPNYDHIHFIQWIQYFMAQGYTIKAAKDAAAAQNDVSSAWVKTGELKILGCWDLTFWGHNN